MLSINCYPVYLFLDGDCNVFNAFVKVGSSSSSLDRPDRLKKKKKTSFPEFLGRIIEKSKKESLATWKPPGKVSWHRLVFY